MFKLNKTDTRITEGGKKKKKKQEGQFFNI